MSEPTHDDLPPLGQSTPARPPRTAGRRSASSLLAAVVALVVGVAVGIPVGQALEGGSDEGASSEAPGGDVEETPLATTTTLAELPQECVETIRSAQQALVLLDEGLQSLSALDLAEVESVLADMQRLREGFARRAQVCLEDPRVGAGG